MVFRKILIGVCLVASATGARAAEWAADSGSVGVDSNWLNSEPPTVGEEALINNGGTATIDEALEAARLTIGVDGGSGAIIQTDGGSVTAGGAFIGDTDGMGSAVISGGEFTIGGDSIHVGWQSGAVGEITVEGVDTIVTSGDDFQLGREGTGTMNFRGGTIKSGWLVVGKFGTGTWNQSGGIWDQDFGDLEIGDGGRDDQVGTEGPREGTLNLSGGFIQSSSAVAIGNRRGTGTMNVSGGVVAATGNGNSSIFIGKGADTTEGEGGPVEMRITGDAATIVANGGFSMNTSEAAVSSTLIAEITGPTHTPIRVAGSADLSNGTLKVELNDYSPMAGDSWLIVEAGAELSDMYESINDAVEAAGYLPMEHAMPDEFGSLGSQFAAVDTSMAPLGAGLQWDLLYDDQSAILQVLAGGLACDINGDGVCDANDIDAMTQKVIDGTATQADRTALVENPLPDGLNTWIGDSDENGQYDEQDFVKVFIEGKYLTGEQAGWVQGDWDGDFLATEQDFVAAFIAGGYLKGQRPAAAAVPEPSSLVLLATSLLMFVRYRRR